MLAPSRRGKRRGEVEAPSKRESMCAAGQWPGRAVSRWRHRRRPLLRVGLAVVDNLVISRNDGDDSPSAQAYTHSAKAVICWGNVINVLADMGLRYVPGSQRSSPRHEKLRCR